MASMMGILAMATMAAGPATPATATAQVLPTVYEAGHFYAVPETADGQKLRLLVDTGGAGGGGRYVLRQDTARRLRLPTRTCDGTEVASLPRFKPGQSIPPPIAPLCGQVALVGQLDVLGAGYLPGRVWRFDYPARRLTLEGSDWRPDPAAHAAPLGFPHTAGGRQADGFARITIRVDGKPLDMLLDTGATSHPTTAGEKASGTPTVKGYGVTSYVTTSVLERWHKAHPDWRVVDRGDDLFGPAHVMRLIEVPKVEIAGWSTGPVWFTERPDHNFHDVMSGYMDKEVEGAVGGNVFRHFTMTIDYPRETAYFRCVKGCKATATPPPAP